MKKFLLFRFSSDRSKYTIIGFRDCFSFFNMIEKLNRLKPNSIERIDDEERARKLLEDIGGVGVGCYALDPLKPATGASRRSEAIENHITLIKQFGMGVFHEPIVLMKRILN